MSAPVYWITGLSGAGKTTLAKLVVGGIKSLKEPVFMLDGDVFRMIFDQAGSHGRESRLDLAMSYSRLAKELSEQGIWVVCATVSLFHDVHDWNRKNIKNYREIFLSVPLSELRSRDSKKIYSKADRGELINVVGIDIPVEQPLNPDLIIYNSGKMTPKDAVKIILDYF